MGLPFESLALRDLRTYAQSLGARLIAVTAFGHAYQTDDAIAVMPLTALKP